MLSTFLPTRLSPSPHFLLISEEMMDSDQIDKFGERTGFSETDLSPLYLGAKCLQKAQSLI